MSPEEFYEKMLQLKKDFGNDEEKVHIKMDDLLCETLSTLGYNDGVQIFEETPMWYS